MNLVTAGFCSLLLLQAGPDAGVFETPVKADDLDPAAFAEWVDGAERAPEAKSGPRHVLWTTTSAGEWNGLGYGGSKTPGLRHLRIGFKRAVDVGSVVVQGGGSLSVLKPGAAGKLDDEAQWIPAQRMRQGAVVRDEVERKEFAVWVLPPGTKTTALRFTHGSLPSDKDYGGLMGGAFVLASRYADLAGQSAATASVNEHHAAKIINARHDDWGPWDNVTETLAPVSKERPEWVVLTWPSEVALRGLCALQAGFSQGEIQIYTGPADRHPRDAAAGDWKSLRSFDHVKNQYPRSFGVNWIDFGAEVKTRALRLLMTKVTDEGHPHLKGNTKDGRRVWLGELLALSPIGADALEKSALKTAEAMHPPIPIRFTLKEAGVVTLVIDDAAGKRVRNLLAEIPFPAGDNTAWWDGLDDLGRDRDAAAHAVYHIPGQFVKPGAYKVNGLVRKEIDLKYEMTVYHSGNPPWPTADRSGGWLADHSPPQSVLYIPGEKPQVMIASYVAEGGDGLVFVDLDGKKTGAIHWLGGNWTGASHLARDAGGKAVKGVTAYTAAGWEQDKDRKKGEIRLMKISGNSAKPVVPFKLENRKDAEVSGLAVHDGILVVSLPVLKQVAIVDVAAEQILGTPELADPRGLAFDASGSLLAISGKTVLRFTLHGGELGKPQELLKGLEDPQQLALDGAGKIYVSDLGKSHQVKIFGVDGKQVGAIGTPWTPVAGPYDPNHLTNPNGVTIADDGRVWVAEHDHQPKRISVWTPDGKLVKAMYGPPQYGGGGALDPKDKTRFYFNGMEFKIDWEKGTNQLIRVFYRAGSNDWATPKGHASDGAPETALHVNGRQYMTNCFNSNPTNGSPLAFLWELRDGIAVPVAAVGQASAWELLKEDAYKAAWPEKTDPKGDPWKSPTMFSWVDLNDDHKVQLDELKMVKGRTGGVVVHPDLTILTSLGLKLTPKGFTPKGAPLYDIAAAETFVEGAQNSLSSGGEQAMQASGGWTILTVGPKPFGADSMAGVKNGVPMWSYPSMWPGLHASHNAPMPEHPGEILGTTRLLGGFVSPKGSDAGDLWAINGNMGNVYLLTADGLFVGTLWKDGRVSSWAMPAATRGMSVKDASLNAEDFWPSMTQTSDGAIYITVGVETTCSIVRVEGLETLRRLPEATVRVTNEALAEAGQYFVKRDLLRAAREGTGTLSIAMKKTAPVVDGNLDDWADAAWVTIDSRTNQVGDWGHEETKTRASLAVAGDRLYAAFKTEDPNLLRNTGEALPMLFKTGGALDLMIGADPAADPKRDKPVAGDVRLVVTMVKNKPMAALYRAVVPGTPNPVPFSSPWRTVTFDRVDDVSAEVQLAAGGEKDVKKKGDHGIFELSIPLSVLGLKPEAGKSIKGDVGLLRGNGFQTMQRVYWQNKATGLISDVPGEAMLTPQLWGKLQFVVQP
ncbi:MAG TPA: hypothetical protein VE981_05100 [Planctomycetota bacterium]|nr:hypothetical protein [Planctomycetota bacterium]